MVDCFGACHSGQLIPKGNERYIPLAQKYGVNDFGVYRRSDSFRENISPDVLSTFFMSDILRVSIIVGVQNISRLATLQYIRTKMCRLRNEWVLYFAIKIRLDSFDIISRRTSKNDYEKWRTMICLDLLSEL